MPGVGELAESQEGAEGLAEDGGQSRAGHAPAEDGHEQQIQYHIGEGGENQILHGTAAVPHRLEDAGAHGVEHYGAGAQEVHSKIGNGISDDIAGGAHPAQNLGGQQNAHHGEHKPGRDAHRYGGVEGAGEIFPVIGAVKAGNNHPGTQGDSVNKPYQQHNHEIADNHGVHGVVELLKEVAEKDGQGEGQHFAGNAALGQTVLVGFIHAVRSRLSV